MLSFLEGPVLVQLFVLFIITDVFFHFLSYVFLSKIKLFLSVLFLDFLLFCFFFVFRLKSSPQKNNLSSSKFGYHGFSFFSHDVRL